MVANRPMPIYEDRFGIHPCPPRPSEECSGPGPCLYGWLARVELEAFAGGTLY